MGLWDLYSRFGGGGGYGGYGWNRGWGSWGGWGGWGGRSSSYGHHYPQHHYPPSYGRRSSGVGSTIIHLVVLVLIARVLWSWMTSTQGFPWHHWARGVFVATLVAKVGISVLAPITPYEISATLFMYKYHVDYLMVGSGGLTIFTLVHAGANVFARVFCAVCGRFIQGITCGFIDAAAFMMIAQFVYEYREVPHLVRHQLDRSVYAGLLAVFVAGNCFYRTQREFGMFSSAALVVSLALAMSTFAYWFQLVNDRGRHHLHHRSHSQDRYERSQSAMHRYRSRSNYRYDSPMRRPGTMNSMYAQQIPRRGWGGYGGGGWGGGLFSRSRRPWFRRGMGGGFGANRHMMPAPRVPTPPLAHEAGMPSLGPQFL